MKQQEQLKFIEQINQKGVELLKSKGHDYAGEDILKNFKQMHQLLEILEIDTSKIEGIHMFYIVLKIQRLCNLLFSNTVAKNESIADTLIDLRNYTDLLNCTIKEKTSLSTVEGKRIPKVGDIVITRNYSESYDGVPLEITEIKNAFCYFKPTLKVENYKNYHNFDTEHIIQYLN